MKRRCPVCDHNQSSPSSYGRDTWVLHTCDACGFLYLPDPPEYEAFEDEFAWEKTYEAEKERRRKERPVSSAISSLLKGFKTNVTKRDKPYALLKRYGQSGKWLDIGCGTGEKFMRIVDDLNRTTDMAIVPYGVEISQVLADMSNQRFSQRGGQCIQGAAVEGILQFEPNSISTIVMISFLEHEVNPMGLLQASYRVLKEGGTAIIKVPNFTSFNRRIRQNAWCGFRYPDHVNYFTPDNLRTTVEKAGFAVKRMSFMDTVPTSDNMYVIVSKPFAKQAGPVKERPMAGTIQE